MKSLFSRPSGFIKQNIEILILSLIIAIKISTGIIWLAQDNRAVDTRDESILLMRTANFMETVKEDGFDGISLDNVLKMSMAGRPILYQLLMIPFLGIFGISLDSATYVNFLFDVLIVIATYNIGRLAAGKRAGVLAAILVIAYPSLIRISLILRSNYAVVGCAALSVWFWMRFYKTHSIKDAWLMNLSLALGFLIHPTFLWGVSIPIALLQIFSLLFGLDPKWVSQPRELRAWLFSKLRQPMFVRGVLPSAIVSIGLILMWYIPVGTTMMAVAEGVAMQMGGTLYLGPDFGNQPYIAPFWFAITSGMAISTVLAVLFGMSLLGAIISRRSQLLMLAFIFFTGYILQSSQLGLGWRYFAQMLPLVAAITGIWVANLRSRMLSALLMVTCISVSSFNFMTVTWGTNTITEPVAESLGLINDKDFCIPSVGLYCAAPPQKEKWPTSDILRLIFNDPDCADGNCNLLIIPESIYFYRDVPFSKSLEFPDEKLGLNYLLAPDAWDAGGMVQSPYFNLPALLESDYTILNLSSGALAIDSAYRDWIEAVYNFFVAPPSLFLESHQVVASYAMPDGSKATLYKRIRPLTWEEAEQSIAALELPDETKFLKYEVFLSLARQEGDVEKVISLYEEALSQTDDPTKRVEYLRGLSDLYLSSGQTDLAMENYWQALDLDPDNFAVHMALANIYVEREDCENAVMLLSEHAWANLKVLEYTGLGDLYQNCGNAEMAVLSYLQALEIRSDFVRARLGLAFSYAAQGQFDQARAEFKKVIKLAPNTTYAKQAKEWLKARGNQ